MSEIKHLGRYKIEERVGSGAYADVYRAIDSVLKRTVALKVLKPALLADEDAFARFTQEAQTAANLIHPQIAWVWDMGDAEGRYYLAMRYVDGLSLDKVLRQRGVLPWPEALAVVQQVAEALSFAHERDLVHRDVKPQNILISPKDGAVLTDFGLVKAMQAGGLSTRSGAIIGTPQYIPPEVWRGEPATPSSDQYALACVLVEMLSGAPLFDAPTPPAVMLKHFQPLEINLNSSPEMLPDVSGILLRALHSEPSQRFPTIAEFLHDLIDSQSGLRTTSNIAINLSDEDVEQLPVDNQNRLMNNSSPVSQDEEQNAAITGEDLAVSDPDFIPVTKNPAVILEGHTDEVLSLAFSPDGAWLASGSVDCTIRLWNLKKLASEPSIFRSDFAAWAVAFSPDGKYLAAGLEAPQIQLWDIKAKRLLPQLDGHKDWIMDLRFSPDGTILASASCDKTIRLWGMSDYSLLDILKGHRKEVSSLCFSPDGRVIVSGSADHSLRIWDVDSGDSLEKVTEFSDWVVSIAFSVNGSMLGVCSEAGGAHIYRYDQDTRTITKVLTLADYGAAASSIAFSPDGTLVAVCYDNGEIILYRTIDWEPIHIFDGQTGPVLNVAFSPEGDFLASCSDDMTVKLWKIQNDHIFKA